IQAALEDKADPLVVEVQGKCQEAVVVRRSGVTIRGTNPATDGLTGPTGSDVLLQVADSGFRNPIAIQGQLSVNLENLAIENNDGGGFLAYNSIVSLTNVWITGHAGMGARFSGGSFALLLDCRLENNSQQGISVARASRIVCTNCEIHGNTGAAGAVDAAGELFLDASNVSGPQGFRSLSGGLIEGFDTDVVATAGPALRAFQESVVNWQTGTLDGRIVADAKSQLNLVDVTQPAGAGTNFVLADSTLTVANSSLARPLNLQTFGNGVITDSTVGTLACATGADLACQGTVVKTSSSCSLCP
ncbi:MAG: right-handed parallel beta-helix repeat-containing protein, partial [Thermoanaerobaculia bacterium]